MLFLEKLKENCYVDAALVVAALAIFAVNLPSRSTQHDFAHYYVSSRILLEGESPYGVPLGPVLDENGFTDLVETDITLATNPPTLLWLFAPLTLLPPKIAFSIWVLVEFGCLACVFWFTWRVIGDGLRPNIWRVFCSAALLSPAVYWHFHYSQIQLLLTALLLAALVCSKSGHHTVSLLLVCTAGMLKLFPFALLPWFMFRGQPSKSTLLQRSVICIAFVAITVLLTGPMLWRNFLVDGREAITAWAMNGQLNYTVASFVYSSLKIVAIETSSGWVMTVAWPLAVVSGFSLIAAAYYLCWRGSDENIQFCLLCVATLCGGATCWIHYHVLLIFPFALFLSHVLTKSQEGGAVYFATILTMVFLHGNLFLDSSLPRHLAIWLSFTPLFGTLCLGWYFMMQLRTRQQLGDHLKSRRRQSSNVMASAV